MKSYAVVDVFAGPGGLAEGFSSVRDPKGRATYRVALSIEKDATAHQTLRLRAFLRQFDGDIPSEYYDFINLGGVEPDWANLFPEQWRAAEGEAWCLELGQEDPRLRLNARLDAIRAEHGSDIVLIGGPPCQAYSLVGRARNQGKQGYIASEDGRHFLYEEYIRILDRIRPAAFVMENVKGLLSSSVDGESRIIDQVLADLGGERCGGERYKLVALAPRSRRQLDLVDAEPSAPDFVVRAEEYGIPQARHRIIIVGLRADLAELGSAQCGTLAAELPMAATAGHVLGGMPTLRSGLSREPDSEETWVEAVAAAMEFVADAETLLPDEQQRQFQQAAERHLQAFRARNDVPGRRSAGVGIAEGCPPRLRDWLVDERLENLPNHVSRSHMRGDLARYFFAALFGEVTGRSPKARDFPEELAPDHASWLTGGFADRFRVQVATEASTTVTSHIAKDGHYFIHPDPSQCRSLTVREAARLQTFPDNYVFKGNRTQQYVQVGNAVPPLLARWIGTALAELLGACGEAEADGAGAGDLRRVA